MERRASRTSGTLLGTACVVGLWQTTCRPEAYTTTQSFVSIGENAWGIRVKCAESCEVKRGNGAWQTISCTTSETIPDDPNTGN